MSASDETGDGVTTQHLTRGRRAKSASEREKIEATMTELLRLAETEGTPLPSALKLAQLAGVNRWVLTHANVDLNAKWQAERRRHKAIAASLPASTRVSKEQKLQDELARLKREIVRLSELVTCYAHELSAVGEYLACASQQGEGAKITPLSRRVLRPRHSAPHAEG